MNFAEFMEKEDVPYRNLIVDYGLHPKVVDTYRRIRIEIFSKKSYADLMNIWYWFKVESIEEFAERLDELEDKGIIELPEDADNCITFIIPPP